MEESTDNFEIGYLVGHYRIVKKVGAGGMGDVYLAEDNRLNRKVALKILPATIAADVDRLRRFEQEAYAASALNHPNILTIHEFGAESGTHFIATEFVDGETLRDRLNCEEIGVIDSLEIAMQIASALSAAHAGGIVHRDIKPENIMIRADGIVKVLDFGLAKLTEKRAMSSSGEAETQAWVKTNPGVVMGTVSYMSPEQARGKPTDERTDIWSLGVCLYEMFTGRLPFSGETMNDVIAAILTSEPLQIGHFIPNAPQELQRIVGKTLRKNCEERYQHSKDLQIDLKDIKEELIFAAKMDRSMDPGSQHATKQADSATQIITPDHLTDQSTISPSTKDTIKASSIRTSSAEYLVAHATQHKWKAAIAVIGFLAVIVGGGWAAYRSFGGTTAKKSAGPFQNIRPSNLADWNNGLEPSLSPDGKYIAYTTDDGSGNYNLKLRQLATGTSSELLPPQPGQVGRLRFSPDGNYVYYLFARKDDQQNKLFRLPTLGAGTVPRELLSDIDSSISFAPDGRRFAFKRHSTKDKIDSVILADADGGETRTLLTTKDAGKLFFKEPNWSPDGTRIVVATSGQSTNSSDEILDISVADGIGSVFNMKKLAGVSDVRWLKNGSGIILSGWETPTAPTQIWFASYPSGETRQVTNDVNNYVDVSVADDNETLVTLKVDFRTSVSTFDPQTKISNQLTPDFSLLNPTASNLTQTPSGKILFVKPHEGDIDNIWQMDPNGKNAQALSTNLLVIRQPVVTPDERFIFFASRQSGNGEIWRTDITGNNQIQLTKGDNDVSSSPQITSDGESVLYFRRDKSSGSGAIMRMSLDGKDASIVGVDTHGLNSIGFILSPSGKKIAIIVQDANTLKVSLLIASVDKTAIGQIDKQIELAKTINSARWSPDERSVTFADSTTADNLYEMLLDGPSKPKQLTNFTSGRISDFGWSRDGKQIFLARGVTNSELIVIKDSPIK